jgi:hypothetical protein
VEAVVVDIKIPHVVAQAVAVLEVLLVAVTHNLLVALAVAEVEPIMEQLQLKLELQIKVVELVELVEVDF